ncbi:hypothetical protein HPP92_020001 [Vanilla planifolia]|uniref:RNA helicase n=1 Tax=Vanilla planifolia TaxID=51239 RepID=A0A835Q9V9_VANPL|nr:hypothetical protein HPP92_020001 [Vanilla planifolia]
MGDIEDVKQKSSKESRKEDSRKGDREKERHRDRDKEKGRDRDYEKVDHDRGNRRAERERSDEEKSQERQRDKDSHHRDLEREKEKERKRYKEKVRDRDKDREREREDRDRDRDRDRGERGEREAREREEREDRDRERAREREEREERERERARRREEREREREREREEWEREREKAREERARERERERTREKRRELGRDEEEEGRNHERKRHRREESRERGERDRDRSSRHREDVEDGYKKGYDEDTEEKERKKREQDLEEEQQKLDEEMDKRRRRVQEWQELRRKKEELEREKAGKENDGESLQPGKNWTLEGESDDEEVVPERSESNVNGDAMAIDGSRPDGTNGDAMNNDSQNGGVLSNGVQVEDGEDEIDPLDAFYELMVLPEVEKLHNTEVLNSKSDDAKLDSQSMQATDGLSNGFQAKKGVKNMLGRILPGEDSEPEDEFPGNEDVPLEDEDDEDFMKRVKKTKAEKLSIVDHSKIQYPHFRKNFYIEVKEIAKMTAEEVAAYRKQLELKVHGKDIPKPIKSWIQTGLASKILDTIKKLNFERPMAIQAQALPIIMSGRDCIGIAKTGSGKTLAFVLPMLRHIKDQPPVVPGDGPIALIMAPTRELVQQIHSDIKKFSKVLGVNCVPVYGGSGVAQQISELKRGAEIVVCTPGRMIDILCTSGGKITNLRRVTYFVMDEADRMFDMGFEPQITRIVQNTRPDRQTVLFSATFPRQVEILARKVLNKPVEIQVGGRSVVNKDITQLVEVRQKATDF